MASGLFLEVGSGGRWAEEAVRVYLIRFIADLPLRLVCWLRDLMSTATVPCNLTSNH